MKNIDANEIFVNEGVFRWDNVPAPGDGYHYCLVARIVTEENPNPIPETGSVTDFARYITEHPNVAWKNVRVTSVNTPTFTNNQDYQQRGEQAEMLFILKGTGIPAGSKAALTSGTTEGANPPINIHQQEFGDNHPLSVTSVISAGYSTNIVYSYWAGGNPEPGWSVSLDVLKIETLGSELYELAKTPKALGLDRKCVALLGEGARAIRMGGDKTIGNLV